MHLLATWRETTAYAPMARLGHHSEDVVEQLLGQGLAARLSVILLPYAGLPWLIGLAVLSLRRGGWRYPALFGLLSRGLGIAQGGGDGQGEGGPGPAGRRL